MMTRKAVTKSVTLFLLVQITLTGCIIIPTSYFTSDSRENIQDETIHMIVPGQTTRDELFLTLGEPDEVYSDGKTVYRWTKVKAFVLLFLGNKAGYLEKRHKITISFNERGIVLQRELTDELWGSRDDGEMFIIQ